MHQYSLGLHDAQDYQVAQEEGRNHAGCPTAVQCHRIRKWFHLAWQPGRYSALNQHATAATNAAATGMRWQPASRGDLLQLGLQGADLLLLADQLLLQHQVGGFGHLGAPGTLERTWTQLNYTGRGANRHMQTFSRFSRLVIRAGSRLESARPRVAKPVPVGAGPAVTTNTVSPHLKLQYLTNLARCRLPG